MGSQLREQTAVFVTQTKSKIRESASNQAQCRFKLEQAQRLATASIVRIIRGHVATAQRVLPRAPVQSRGGGTSHGTALTAGGRHVVTQPTEVRQLDMGAERPDQGSSRPHVPRNDARRAFIVLPP